MALSIVTVSEGRLQGADYGRYSVFRGIPYARPPVGSLRFRAPEPPEPWTGTRRATDFSPACWQTSPEHGSFYEKEFYRGDRNRITRSEDCLFLNVWTPAGDAAKKLPVVFWIHGGAFDHGYGHETEFDGAAFCRHGVILVTFNYRLGVFGFLSHPWLGKDGNWGIRDQLCALGWVRANISAFGGDPENITVAGQSAGAFSAQALLACTQAGSIAARAVLQSGGGYLPQNSRFRPLSEGWAAGEALTAACGIRSCEALRAADARTLLEAAVRLGLHFSPVVDGRLLTDDPNRLVEQSRFPSVPCILGSTRNDIGVTPEEAARGVRPSAYTGSAEFARKMARQKKGPVFLYTFDRDLPGDAAGAFHSSELWYLFGTLGRSWRPFTPEDRLLSEKMIAYWCNFARSGKPGWVGGEEWLPYGGDPPFILSLRI